MIMQKQPNYTAPDICPVVFEERMALLDTSFVDATINDYDYIDFAEE